jgi:hypothetical protein
MRVYIDAIWQYVCSWAAHSVSGNLMSTLSQTKTKKKKSLTCLLAGVAMSNVTDIDEIVKSWAWTSFVRTRSKDHTKLRFEDVHLEVNWSRVRFTPSSPNYSDENMVESPKSQVVFKSTFVNNTETEQEHSFQTTRSTSCISSTSVSKGFTKGFSMELSLKLPEEIVSATAGFGREVNMQSGEEDSKEQTLTWAVDSTIKVPAKHRTTAEMVVKEQEFNASFTMNVLIKGQVIVVVTSLKDNNSFVQSVEGDVAQILSDEKKRGREGYTVNGQTVTWELAGKCEFRFGIEQQVQLHEVAL